MCFKYFHILTDTVYIGTIIVIYHCSHTVSHEMCWWVVPLKVYKETERPLHTFPPLPTLHWAWLWPLDRSRSLCCTRKASGAYPRGSLSMWTSLQTEKKNNVISSLHQKHILFSSSVKSSIFWFLRLNISNFMILY